MFEVVDATCVVVAEVLSAYVCIIADALAQATVDPEEAAGSNGLWRTVASTLRGRAEGGVVVGEAFAALDLCRSCSQAGITGKLKT